MYTIALCHRRTSRAYFVKAERDEIFFAYPSPRTHRDEVIFLAKASGHRGAMLPIKSWWRE